MKSKIGKSLYFIFGAIQEVRSFDEHHLKFRDFQYESSRLMCQTLKSKMSPQIKEINLKATKVVQNWEKEFFKLHLREPTTKDMDNEIMEANRRRSHSKLVMKTWKL